MADDLEHHPTIFSDVIEELINLALLVLILFGFAWLDSALSADLPETLLACPYFLADCSEGFPGLSKPKDLFVIIFLWLSHITISFNCLYFINYSYILVHQINELRQALM